MIYIWPRSLVAWSRSIQQTDKFPALFSQVLEDEKVKEAMAARNIPAFNSGDSLQIKLVRLADSLELNTTTCQCQARSHVAMSLSSPDKCLYMPHHCPSAPSVTMPR